MRDGTVKTATEVISNNSDLYRNLQKHELLLTDALTGMIRAICDILKVGKNQDVRISYDDSIIQDSDREREKDRQDVRDNLMKPYEYRMKWYGEDEETAKKMTQQEDGLTLE